ncbi:cadmium resistance transporter [Micromonospora sp. B11E3]|uniref:cadmium resistance transporter n=1 Tax=Micromonospora sp. B11E3 TaxID=3153562 RepID=UPI00325CFD79
MTDLLAAAAGAALVFAATNLDDIVVLTVLFVAARGTGRPRPRHIVAGQYLGIGALVAAAVVVAAGLLVVPDPWTGLLGLLPIGLGVRALLAREDDDSPRWSPCGAPPPRCSAATPGWSGWSAAPATGWSRRSSSRSVS